MVGVYVFADFAGVELGALRCCNGQACGPVAVPLSQIIGATAQISSFVEGHDGELYVRQPARPRSYRRRRRRCVRFFPALAQKTTGATITVDGGNIEASLR